MITAISTGKVTEIRVGIIETIALYYLPKIMESFKKVYPEILIKLVLESEENLIKLLENHEIDMTFLFR